MVEIIIAVISFCLFGAAIMPPTLELSPPAQQWSSGGKGIGSTQEVTQRSFIDYRLSIIDIDFPDALH